MITRAWEIFFVCQSKGRGMEHHLRMKRVSDRSVGLLVSEFQKQLLISKLSVSNCLLIRNETVCSLCFSRVCFWISKTTLKTIHSEVLNHSKRNRLQCVFLRDTLFWISKTIIKTIHNSSITRNETVGVLVLAVVPEGYSNQQKKLAVDMPSEDQTPPKCAPCVGELAPGLTKKANKLRGVVQRLERGGMSRHIPGNWDCATSTPSRGWNTWPLTFCLHHQARVCSTRV